jgi:hypothetical protein
MTFCAKKIIVISLVTAGLVSFIIQLLLFFYLMEYAPTQPNAVTGEIYPLNNHGYIFYVIKAQSLLQNILFYVFIIFAFGGAILNLRWKTIRSPYNEMPKKPDGLL